MAQPLAFLVNETKFVVNRAFGRIYGRGVFNKRRIIRNAKRVSKVFAV